MNVKEIVLVELDSCNRRKGRKVRLFVATFTYVSGPVSGLGKVTLNAASVYSFTLCLTKRYSFFTLNVLRLLSST